MLGVAVIAFTAGLWVGVIIMALMAANGRDK